MNDLHKQSVKNIAGRVKELYIKRSPFYIYHGSTNTTRIMSFKKSETIDISALKRVISVNQNNKTALVEPNVPMDSLVKETLKYNLMPPVVMEFPGITVGGGIQGAGGESSSFRWGCFNRISNWYEMILANGEIIKTSQKENSDLFNGTASSCGTLGIITAAEIQLIPAKKYVQLTYLPVKSFEDAKKTLIKVTAEKYDFVDGIMFGKNHGIIMMGKLSNNVEGSVVKFSRAHNQWFYLHAESIDKKGKLVTESIPLVDYLFRYDRGAFWVGRYAFQQFGVSFSRFNRWLLNPLLHTRKLYQAIQNSGATQQYIVQDLGLPLEKVVEFMNFIDLDLNIYPLWLCPIKPDPDSPLQLNGIKTPLVINVGVWSSRIDSYDEFIRQNRLIEKKLMELGGKKWFYAHSYYTEKEFWSIYDKNWYDKLRIKYHAGSLPNIFNKTQVTKRYEINAKKGLINTIFGRAKLPLKD
jgi:FAD/FMN-containing dehydrogenase